MKVRVTRRARYTVRLDGEAFDLIIGALNFRMDALSQSVPDTEASRTRIANAIEKLSQIRGEFIDRQL